MSPEVTKEQVRSAVDVVLVLAEAIREAKQIPSGHLYAMVMGSVDIGSYDRVLQILKGARLVEERNYLLTWIGPEVSK